MHILKLFNFVHFYLYKDFFTKPYSYPKQTYFEFSTYERRGLQKNIYGVCCIIAVYWVGGVL
jgi:hypothetical protein